MKKYHKIETLFKRDPNNNYKTVLQGVFVQPELDQLQRLDWSWYEKVDGTNIRVIFDGHSVEFRGKTDRALIQANLYKELEKLFPVQMLKWKFPDANPDKTICLYGEGYGGNIQKCGPQYNPHRTGFCLFDIKVADRIWLTRNDILDVGYDLGLTVVPAVGHGSLWGAMRLVKDGFKSLIAHDPGLMAEGLILKPMPEMLYRNGQRVIYKLKTQDFH